ncbi:MAG: hypothetical protein K9G76_05280 [Bacteroidales bacterium]|nr:hypothetical protein [Bacteroidales bacterium]MCF8403091.1 hypothetical protein [Bacteroidales bacterium]
MKQLTSILLLIIITLTIPSLFGQEIRELPFKALNPKFITLKKTLKEINTTDDQKSIDLSLEALDKFNDKNVRFDLMVWESSVHYANLKQYNQCFEILKQGQQEGMFYYIRSGDRPFPAYIPELEKLDGYEAFLKKNQELSDEAAKTSKAEFMVQLPDNYSETNHYPLMLIMHGGWGNIPDIQYSYISEKLKSEFIVAYFQGSIIRASELRSFEMEGWQPKIKQGYEEIVAKYAVDTSRVIVGGPSAGGYRSLILGLEHIIPVSGLLLSFPVYPRDSDTSVFIQSAERGLKVAMLCGENDWAIQQQKKLGYLLDKYGIRNRFVVFPEEGHGFPENWSYYLNTSLAYLLENTEEN